MIGGSLGALGAAGLVGTTGLAGMVGTIGASVALLPSGTLTELEPLVEAPLAFALAC